MATSLLQEHTVGLRAKRHKARRNMNSIRGKGCRPHIVDLFPCFGDNDQAST